MDFLGELCLINKAKSTVSSLSGMVMLWATGSPSPLQTPSIKGIVPTLQQCHDLQQIGLKTLIGTHPKIHHQQILFRCYMASPSPPPKMKPPTSLSTSPYSSWSQVLDDLIGTDSGVHSVSFDSIGQTTSIEHNNNNNNKHFSYKDRIHDKRANRRPFAPKSEKYPPPLPRLACTGRSLARGQSMPWVWTRRYEDGNIILQGRPLERHEYFEARRHDGRLILDLVSIENNTCNDDHQTRSRSCEEESIQFDVAGYYNDDHDGNKDHDHVYDNDDQNVAALESLCEMSSRSTSLGAAKGLTYACGMFMDMHERSKYPFSVEASSSAPLVRPLTSVIM